MSRSEKQPKTKRAKAWACVLDADVVCIHHSKAAAADCSRAGTSRPAHLVERLPGDVLLSREDAEELREVVSSPMLLSDDRNRALALLRGRR